MVYQSIFNKLHYILGQVPNTAINHIMLKSMLYLFFQHAFTHNFQEVKFYKWLN